MIPVLGVPILSRPVLLRKMMDSVDVDTLQTIVIDNGGVVPEDFTETPYCSVIRLPHNIGCGAGWNLILQVTPTAPWWALVNNDIIFEPGELAKMAEKIELHTQLGDPAVVLLGSFYSFALNRYALERVGYFDENFHPAYFEDNDYHYRCKLADVPVFHLPTSSVHKGSATIRGNIDYRKQNSRTFVANQDYYVAKWGGTPRHELFTRPFQQLDIRDVTVDPRRLKELAWDRS